MAAYLNEDDVFRDGETEVGVVSILKFCTKQKTVVGFIPLLAWMQQL